MRGHLRRRSTILTFALLLPLVHAFSFNTSDPTQCDDLTVSWSGGVPPFQLVMLPRFDVIRNVSIPANSFNNGQGTFSFQIPFPQGQKFVITMSDATGFATGGTTDILTTGASQGGSCNTTSPKTTFEFDLNSALQQCSPYVFSGYSSAIQPVTIIGTIPGGTSVVLTPPSGSTTFSWTANVAAGTSILFTMIDSQANNGGTSDIEIVGITNDATCLNNNSPSSTSSRPTSTLSSGTSDSTLTTSAVPPSSSAQPEKTSIAAIAGSVIGALIFLAVVITLGLFFLRKKRDDYNRHLHSRSELDLTYDPSQPRGEFLYPNDTATAPIPPPLVTSSGEYNATPFPDRQLLQPYQPSEYGSLYSQYLPTSQYQSLQSQEPQLPHQIPINHQYHSPGSETDPFNPYTIHSQSPSVIQPFDLHSSDQSSIHGSTTSAQRKAALAGVSTHKPSRFIVHTDVEDDLPQPNEDGIVELPPQYSERHAQLHISPAASSSTPET